MKTNKSWNRKDKIKKSMLWVKVHTNCPECGYRHDIEMPYEDDIVKIICDNCHEEFIAE